VLLIPVVILVWLAGWAVYWAGSLSMLRENETVAGDDGIEVAVAVFEEYEESRN
jgi:hypothetical protein